MLKKLNFNVQSFYFQSFLFKKKLYYTQKNFDLAILKLLLEWFAKIKYYNFLNNNLFKNKRKELNSVIQ